MIGESGENMDLRVRLFQLFGRVGRQDGKLVLCCAFLSCLWLSVLSGLLPKANAYTSRPVSEAPEGPQFLCAFVISDMIKIDARLGIMGECRKPEAQVVKLSDSRIDVEMSFQSTDWRTSPLGFTGELTKPSSDFPAISDDLNSVLECLRRPVSNCQQKSFPAEAVAFLERASQGPDFVSHLTGTVDKDGKVASDITLNAFVYLTDAGSAVLIPMEPIQVGSYASRPYWLFIKSRLKVGS